MRSRLERRVTDAPVRQPARGCAGEVHTGCSCCPERAGQCSLCACASTPHCLSLCEMQMRQRDERERLREETSFSSQAVSHSSGVHVKPAFLTASTSVDVCAAASNMVSACTSQLARPVARSTLVTRSTFGAAFSALVTLSTQPSHFMPVICKSTSKASSSASAS